MTTVTTRELKNRLSEYLRRAKAGEQIVVTSRGKPVASLGRAPAVNSKETLDEKLDRLEAEGFLRRGRGKMKLPERLIKLRGEGPSLSEMVLADRGEPIP